MSRRKRVLAVAVAVSMALAGVTQQALANVDNTWTGTVSQDYNNPGNWALGHLPTNASNPQEDGLINTATGNFPTITADFANPPTDMFVGRDPGNTARLDQSAGTAANAGGNWMFIGADGSTGTWNLANTAASGGAFTHFGQGSGSINDTGRLYVGGRQTNGAGVGTFNVNTTGTVTTGSDFAIGTSNGTGTVNVDAGSISIGGWLLVGSDHNGNAANGTLNMSGGSINVTNAGAHMTVGLNGSSGTLNMTGGSITSAGEIWFGEGTGAGGVGTASVANISGGTINATNWLAIGRQGGVAVVNVSGSAFINKTGTNDDIVVGTAVGAAVSNGTLNVSGGTVSTGRDLIIAEQAGDTGTVNQSGGVVRVTRNILLQEQPTGFGKYTLSGGKLFIDGSLSNTSGGSFSFTGGTLTRDDATAPLSIQGDLAPGGRNATLGLDGGKTFTLTGTLNVDPGFTLDLTGQTIPTTPGATGAIQFGTVGGVLGTFDTASNPIVGLGNPGNATYIDELAGESHAFSSTQSVYWLQTQGGAVSLDYSIASVPEPTSIGIFVLTGAAMLARRRKRGAAAQ